MAELSQLQFIWKQVSERIQNLVSPISYNTYIKTLEPVDIMGRVLVLKAETPLGANTISTEWLTRLEQEHPLFPWMNYRIFSKKQ